METIKINEMEMLKNENKALKGNVNEEYLQWDSSLNCTIKGKKNMNLNRNDPNENIQIKKN